MHLLIIFWSFVGTTFLINDLPTATCIEEGDDPSLYFIKDDGMDSKFPPTMVRTISEDIPTGHLRSLGYQRPTDGPVKEQSKAIPPNTFFEEYVKSEEPLVIRGVIEETQALRQTWTDERLKKIHGDSKVWIIKRHERSSKKPIRTTINRFLDFYKLQDIYIASTVPEELMKEMIYPNFMKCGPVSRNLVESELWMAYGGTGSLLHYHGDHQVHCLADGRKDFILIHKRFKNSLKMVEKHPFTGEGYSLINTEMINMFEEQQFADISWIYTTLLAGDCLFIPSGYIHQVRSLGRSLSYVIQFAPTQNNTLSFCDDKQKSEETTLDELDFIYTERNGVEQLKNRKLTAENLRSILYKLVRTNSQLPFEGFQYFYNIAIGKVNKKMPTARSVFNNIDSKGEGHIMYKEIGELTEAKLQKVANILNSASRTGHDEL